MNTGSYKVQSGSSAWFRFLFPSVTDLVFTILLAAMTAGMLAPRLLGDASIGWHIRNGELMLSSHRITRADPFSVTMGGQAWYAWEWLYDVAIAGMHHWFGLNGVVLFTAVVIAATFALTLRLVLRRGAGIPAAAVLLALALGASMIHLWARPHVLSWLFTVICFHLLDSSASAERRRLLWWLPGLMLFWVNIHGGFVVGFVLLGLYLASCALLYFRCRDPEMRAGLAGRLRQLSLVSGASFAASLINPYGYRLHVHVYRYLSSRWLMNHIDEFLSPDFHGVAQQCFAVILLITIVTLAAGRKLPPAQLLVLLFAAYSGLYASRSLPVSSLLLTLIVTPLITRTISDGAANAELHPRLRTLLSRWASFGSRMCRMEMRLRGHVWPAAAVVVGLWICAHHGRVRSPEGNSDRRLSKQWLSKQWMDARFDASRFPVQACQIIAQRGVRDPIFAPDWWGGYLIYRLYPQNKVFVDDRHDFYGEHLLKSYLKAERITPDWDSFLKAESVNWALLPPGSALANMLEQTSDWSVIYRDGTAVLFRRTM